MAQDIYMSMAKDSQDTYMYGTRRSRHIYMYIYMAHASCPRCLYTDLEVLQDGEADVWVEEEPILRFWVWGSGFRVQDSGFRVWDLGCGV